MAANIGLKSIKDLLGMNFFIPDYQRDYRNLPRTAQALDAARNTVHKNLE